MNAYLIALVSFIVLFLLAAGFVLYHYANKFIFPYSPATFMVKEVFIVKVFGRNLLGSGALVPGYSYASTLQINQAISNGLRCTVSKGDWILYASSDSATNYDPNGMIAQGTEFSDGNYISFVSQPNPHNQTSGQYWVCLYGYKPITTSDVWYRLFWHDPDSPIETPNYTGVQTFNPTSWNDTSLNGSSEGNEVFWCSFSGSPATPDSFTFVKGFDFATSDQYLWSFSRGLGDGWQQSVTFTVPGSVSSAFQTVVSVLNGTFAVPNMTTCSSNCSVFDYYQKGVKMYAIWGNKADATKASGNIVNGITATIYPFNSTKSSQYA